MVIECYNLIRQNRSQRRGDFVIMHMPYRIEFLEIVDLYVSRADQVRVKFTTNKISNDVRVIYRPTGFMESQNFL